MKKLNLMMIALCVGSFVYGQEQDSIDHNRRWVNQLQIGQLLDGNQGITGRISASWASGIQVNKVFSGLELGYNDYGPFKLGSIAISSSYRLIEKGFSPYIHGTVGYGHPIYYQDYDRQVATNNRRGGVLYGIGMGVAYPVGKMELTFQMGYKFQKIVYDQSNYYYPYYDRLSIAPGDYFDGRRTARKMNRVEFKMGIVF